MRRGGLVVALVLGLLAPVEACWTGHVVSVEAVIDGDTIRVDLSIWIGMVATETIRILGVDTPEKADREKWAAAAQFTKEWLAASGYTEVTVCRRDSFGRALGVVKSRQKGDLAAALLYAGHAVPYTK
jgi:endonuclease YncB( thermonuclease family)